MIKDGSGPQMNRVVADPADVTSATSFLNQVSKIGIKAGYVERESPEF
jgi:hypothetical protein